MPYAKAKLSEYARKLSAHDLFDAMSAVRGPDNNDSFADFLKGILTTRIRFILFGEKITDSRSGPLWESSTFDFANFKDAIASRKKRKPHPIAGERHFINHLKHAIEATSTHPIWNGNANELASELYELMNS